MAIGLIFCQVRILDNAPTYKPCGLKKKKQLLLLPFEARWVQTQPGESDLTQTYSGGGSSWESGALSPMQPLGIALGLPGPDQGPLEASQITARARGWAASTVRPTVSPAPTRAALRPQHVPLLFLIQPRPLAIPSSCTVPTKLLPSHPEMPSLPFKLI